MITALILLNLVLAGQGRDLHGGKQKIRISAVGTGNQSIECYEEFNQAGASITRIDYTPSLYDLYVMTGQNFDDVISSCCVTGVWLVYSKEDYNEGSPRSSNWWVYGDNYCVNVPVEFDNTASSLRFTGAPDSWTSDTLNFYLEEYFIGGEEYTYADTPQFNFDSEARSLIVTGCSAWTLYDEVDYKGRCRCVWPSDTSACHPGFYASQQSLGSMSAAVSSAKKGCFCGATAAPDNRGVRSLGGGASRYFPTRQE